MKIKILILLFLIIASCNNNKKLSKLETVETYITAEREFNKSVLSEILSDSVKYIYGDSIGNETKKDIILSTGFNHALSQKNKTLKTSEAAPNKVQIVLLERNDVTDYLKIDSIVYKYTYIIEKEQIQKIILDTLDNPNFNYLEQEKRFNEGSVELMNWIYKNYPEKSKLMDKHNYDYRAGKILAEMIKKRENVQ